MPFCAFGDSYALFDCTPVENFFLQEYMLRAPGNYVKVYLYGLMQCYHPQEAMSLARMARDMGIDEEEVFQAFQYWERMGLTRRVADNPAQYVFKNLKHSLLMSAGGGENLYQYKEFNQMLHALLSGKRKLYDQDYRRIYEWIETLALPEDVVILLIRHCIDQYGVRFSFEKADALARDWAERGVRTMEEAEELAQHTRQQLADVKKVLRRLGQRREPSLDEQTLYHTWTAQWGFTLPAILEACRETTKGTPTMAYLGGILQRQHKLGLHGASEVADGLAAEARAAEPVKALYRILGRRGAAPTDEDVRRVQAWLDAGATPELLDIAARVAHRNGGDTLDAVGQRLDAWRQKGLTTRGQVDAYLDQVRRDNAQLTEIYEACGAAQRAGAADRALLATWRDQWGMPQDVLLLAAQAAAHAQAKLPFMDKILADWHRAGIHTLAAAQAERQARRGMPAGASSAPAGAALRPVREVAQHRYPQRDYAPEELDALVFDIWQDVKEAEKEGGAP
jgi:DnaD/phage-associated family protein